jgi:hypothetical protein
MKSMMHVRVGVDNDVFVGPLASPQILTSPAIKIIDGAGSAESKQKNGDRKHNVIDYNELLQGPVMEAEKKDTNAQFGNAYNAW